MPLAVERRRSCVAAPPWRLLTRGLPSLSSVDVDVATLRFEQTGVADGRVGCCASVAQAAEAAPPWKRASTANGTASLAAIEGAARSEHYAATKGAMVSMVRALAVEFARHGIRANSILPGWIETDMTSKSIGNEKFVSNVMPRIPMRRWGTGADFGGIAVYLTSDASTYHTGDTFLIDGGYALF